MSLQTLSVAVEWKQNALVWQLYLTVTTPLGTTTIGPLHTSPSTGAPLPAVYTGVIEEPKEKSRVSAKRQRRTSMKREDAVAQVLGGRRQKGSGSVASLKGDVRVRDKFRVEHKHTRAGSYRVTQNELSKIRGECTGLEIPLFIIEFLEKATGRLQDSWTMIETHHFQKLDYKPAYAADIDSRPPASR
jgi:hypothetical protein